MEQNLFKKSCNETSLLCFIVPVGKMYLSVLLIYKNVIILTCRLNLSSRKEICSVENADIYRSIKKESKLQKNDFSKLIIYDQSIFSYVNNRNEKDSTRLNFIIEHQELLFGLEEFKNFIVRSFNSKNLEYFHSKKIFAFKDPITLDLTISEYFELAGVKNNILSKLVFQILVLEFIDWTVSLEKKLDENILTNNFENFSEKIEAKSIIGNTEIDTRDKQEESSINFTKSGSNTAKSSGKHTDNTPDLNSVFHQLVVLNSIIDRVAGDVRYLVQKLNSVAKTQKEPLHAVEMVFSSESHDLNLLPKKELVYSYNHINPEETYMIFDFELLKIVIDNANFDGKRMIRQRKAQLRIIYLILWAFGLDLSELIKLSKIDLEMAIKLQKIHSVKRDKWHVIREDESLGFVLKTLENEIKVFFTNYDYEFIGTSLKEPENVIQDNYFHVLPNTDLEKIVSKFDTSFNTTDSYYLSWRSIKKSYDVYLSNL